MTFEDAPSILEDGDDAELADTLTVAVRSALTGEQWREVRLHPSDTVAGLRKGIADAMDETCSLWLLLAGRLLQDRDSLEQACILDKCTIDVIRCQPVPAIAPPPTAPANIEVTIRYALSGAHIDKLEFWPTDSLASLRETVVKKQGWDGPVQLLLPGDQPLVGPMTLLDAGLFDGVVIDAVRCDSRFLLTSSADHTVRLLNVESGAVLMSLQNAEWVNSATASADGQWVLASLFNSTAQLWDTESGTLGAALIGHTAPVLWGAFSPDSTLIGTASYDHSAKLWSTETGEVIREFIGHSDGVLYIVFSPTGQQVATSSYDRTAKLWNVETGDCVNTFTGHSDEIRSVSFSPDGRVLSTASSDSLVKMWDAESGNCTQTFAGHRSAVNSVTFSPHGRFLLTGAADRTARLWDARTAETLMEFAGHDDVVTSASFSIDGQLIATASADCTTRLWAVESGESVASLSGHSDVVTSVCFTAGSR